MNRKRKFLLITFTVSISILIIISLSGIQQQKWFTSYGLFRSNDVPGKSDNVNPPFPEVENPIADSIRREHGERSEQSSDLDRQFLKNEKYPPGYGRKMIEHVRNMPKRYPGRQLSKGTGIQSTGWENRGPNNVGGRTRALAIDVTDETRILAGGVSSGMWLSENSGKVWKKTTRPDQLQSASCVTQDTRTGKTHIWYYGTGEFHGSSPVPGNGIYKSIDGGNSWEVLPVTTTENPRFENCFDYIWEIVTNPYNTDQDELIAACFSCIMRSTDGGETWEKVLGEDSIMDSVNKRMCPNTDIIITNEGVYYAAIGGFWDSSYWSPGLTEGIYRSEDGINWTLISTLEWKNKHKRIVIGNSAANSDVVYFLSYSPGYGTNDHSLLRYTYTGADSTSPLGYWTDLSVNIPDENDSYYERVFNSMAGYCLTIAVHPEDEDIVFLGGVDLYYSTDGFKSKSEIVDAGRTSSRPSPGGPVHVDVHNLVFLPSNPDFVYCSSDGGVSTGFYNEEFAWNKWTTQDTGYITTQFYTIAIDHAAFNDHTIIGGLQDNGTLYTYYSEMQNMWNDIGYGDGKHCAIANNKDAFFYSNQYGYIVRLILGVHGELIDYSPLSPGDGYEFTYSLPFVLDRNDQELMYICYNRNEIWRNKDLSRIPVDNYYFGKFNWERLSNTTVDENNTIITLEVSKNPANIVYYGTKYSRKIYRLDNANTGDPVPVDVSIGEGCPNHSYINCLAVNPENADEVIAVFLGHSIRSIYYTDDGGVSWTDISGNLEENPDGTGAGPDCRWAEILEINGNTIYFIATTAGLFSTTEINGSETVWKQEGPETIGCVPVLMIDSRSTDGFVAVATHGNGVYSANFTEIPTNVEDDNIPVPVEFELRQNYPNPFNSGTTIEFTLPEFLQVKVAVYNLLGQEVKTILNSNMPYGTHTVRWDGRDNFGRSAASGMYIYRIIAGNHVESRRMVLIK